MNNINVYEINKIGIYKLDKSTKQWKAKEEERTNNAIKDEVSEDVIVDSCGNLVIIEEE